MFSFVLNQYSIYTAHYHPHKTTAEDFEIFKFEKVIANIKFAFVLRGEMKLQAPR